MRGRLASPSPAPTASGQLRARWRSSAGRWQPTGSLPARSTAQPPAPSREVSGRQWPDPPHPAFYYRLKLIEVMAIHWRDLPMLSSACCESLTKKVANSVSWGVQCPGEGQHETG